jgi:hypothetical protein
MTARTITCADVEAEGLEARYVAGTLPDPDAAAFEDHYFECVRCWDRVQHAMEVRAGLETLPPAAPGPAPVHARRRAAWAAWPIAAAAVVLVALGIRRLRPSPGSGEPAMRGPDSVWAIRTAAGPGRLSVDWPRVAGAERYRVRLLAADGALLLQRETADTGVAIAIDSLPQSAARAPAFWEIEALDGLNAIVKQSEPEPTEPRATPR